MLLSCQRLRTPVLLLLALCVVLSTATLLASAVFEDETRCGFDELEARTGDTRVRGVSRVVGPTAAAGTASTEWQPLRIRVFTLDLDDSSRYCTAAGDVRPDFEGGTVNCTSADVLTDAKKAALTELLIPSATELHADRLNVPRVDGSLVVDASIRTDPVCGQFTVPAEHTTTGVSDADFVLYVSAGPVRDDGIAWATTCQTLADTGRPSVGVMTVSPRHIAAHPRTVRLLAHQVLHALGFNADTFAARGMMSAVDLRGKGDSPALTSANVVAQAQVQYGCPTQTFMELEDFGGNATATSHWKRRSAKDELMAGTRGVGRYTALTIAAMEDLGFYRGNYANAEPMTYGRNAGCSLTTSKCVSDNVSLFPDMFCDGQRTVGSCTSDHTALGRCDAFVYLPGLPPHFVYFTNNTYGSSDSQMDYCPYMRPYSWASCTVNSTSLRGSMFGVNSRCFDAPDGISLRSRSYGQYGICAEVQCAASSYTVKVFGAFMYVPCPPGATLPLANLSLSFSRGTLVCPAYDDVCVGRVNETEYAEYGAIASEEMYPEEPIPSAAPTAAPTTSTSTTAAPTASPITTATPTAAPTTSTSTTAAPTASPTTTATPTAAPTTSTSTTAAPTASPTTTATPTAAPTTSTSTTAAPTASPTTTATPTAAPTTSTSTTAAPTAIPITTATPTAAPTTSTSTTAAPTAIPITTATPTAAPTTSTSTTAAPTAIPITTATPTAAPTTSTSTTAAPTAVPTTTATPTAAPTTSTSTTAAPTASPTTTATPTAAPTTSTSTTAAPTASPTTTATPTAAPTTSTSTTAAPTPTDEDNTTVAPRERNAASGAASCVAAATTALAVVLLACV